MKKIKLVCAMGNGDNDKTSEVRTAYMLPTIHGLNFCVTRNDHADNRAVWSVSHYGTGYKAGPACHTRQDAIDSFVETFNWIVQRNGIKRIKDIISREKTINHIVK